MTGCNLRCRICYSAYDTLKNSRIIPRERLMALLAQFLDAPGRGAAFARHVLAMGAQVRVRCIATRNNLGQFQALEAELHAKVVPRVLPATCEGCGMMGYCRT